MSIAFQEDAIGIRLDRMNINVPKIPMPSGGGGGGVASSSKTMRMVGGARPFFMDKERMAIYSISLMLTCKYLLKFANNVFNFVLSN